MTKKLFSILYISIKLFAVCYIMNKINISLGITAVATLAMFFLPNLVSANALNATISIDLDSIKPHLDQAKSASDSGGDYPTALKHIELAERTTRNSRERFTKRYGYAGFKS